MASSPLKHRLVNILVSALVAAPVGAVLWFELTYLWFGLTGENPASAVNKAALIVAFATAFGWPLHRAPIPAEILRRGCRLGIVVSLLLPVVSVAVLVIWENSVRPDLGMGGLMLYNLPFVSLVVTVLFVILFSLVHRLSRRWG